MQDLINFAPLEELKRPQLQHIKHPRYLRNSAWTSDRLHISAFNNVSTHSFA
jgi:hypothetical protein